MNLQNAFPQPSVFPFPNRNSGEELFEKKENFQAFVPEQQFELLGAELVEARSKENLILSWEVLSVIGENGKNRFEAFKRYPSGWYGGKGTEISKYSVANFERFVKRLPELKLVRPSVFLTLDGNIALGWEDFEGKSCEIEFFPDKVEYFIESLNEESSVGLVNIFDLAKKIRGLF